LPNFGEAQLQEAARRLDPDPREPSSQFRRIRIACGAGGQ
jgi:hypothetical protein